MKQQIYSAWHQGARNVMAVLPTGGGKTVVFSNILAEYQGASVAIAHRQEIVTQISLALARNEVRHRIVGPSDVARTCTSLHLNELNRNYIDPSNRVAVAGVDTLIRMDQNNPWLKTVGLVVQDECHHLLKKNKWGAAHAMFPNAKGLGVTATPVRADGQGLGQQADGVMEAMILGPNMRQLIADGWLTDYRIFAPPSDLDLRDVPLSAGGDFSPVKLSKAVHKSHIVGDVVQHYSRIAPGKLGITFAVDVAAAVEIALAYRNAGVPAEVVSAKTPDLLRQSILRRFRNREVRQLVNVDLFGEGFDLPAIEVVSMARPTQSFTLFAQQFGRALRPMEGKDYAIIIDHVGNVHRHGLPDAPRVWTLERREKNSRGLAKGVLSVRTCVKCAGVYESYRKSCPFCGHVPEYFGRSAPEEVDGDLYELTPEALARLRGEIEAPPTFPYSATPEIIGAIKKRHREKTEAQAALKQAMAQWGGKHSQRTDVEAVRELQRLFFHTFGIDVASAQALGRREAEELIGRIQ